MNPDVGTFISKHESENQERPHSTIRKCAGKAPSPNNICIYYIYLLIVGYGCYRTGHSACGPLVTQGTCLVWLRGSCTTVDDLSNGCPNDF